MLTWPARRCVGVGIVVWSQRPRRPPHHRAASPRAMVGSLQRLDAFLLAVSHSSGRPKGVDPRRYDGVTRETVWWSMGLWRHWAAVKYEFAAAVLPHRLSDENPPHPHPHPSHNDGDAGDCLPCSWPPCPCQSAPPDAEMHSSSATVWQTARRAAVSWKNARMGTARWWTGRS